MKVKKERQSIIRSIIARKRVGNQDELINLLKNEGLDVAQATLSRDLHELGVSKVHDGVGYKYRLPTAAESAAAMRNVSGRLPSELVLSCEFSGNICVLKTHPGHASMLSAIIDGKDLASSAGTVAGDDTVLLIVRNGHSHTEIVGDLSRLFGDLSKKIVE